MTQKPETLSALVEREVRFLATLAADRADDLPAVAVRFSLQVLDRVATALPPALHATWRRVHLALGILRGESIAGSAPSAVPEIDHEALAAALADHCLRHQLPVQQPDRLRIELGLVQGQLGALQIALRAGLLVCRGPETGALSPDGFALCAPDGTLIVAGSDLGALAIALIDHYLGADSPSPAAPVARPSAPASSEDA